MKKQTKKSQAVSEVAPKLDCLPTYGLYGLLLAFVVVSVIYGCYIVWMGTNTWVPKAMMAPQALFAAIVFVRKFVKK